MGECGYSVWYMVYSEKIALLQQRALRSALCTRPASSDNPNSGRCSWRQPHGRSSSATGIGALRHLLARLQPQLFHLCPQLARPRLRDHAAPWSPPLRPSLPSLPSVLLPSPRRLGVYLGWSLQRCNYCLHPIAAGIRYEMQHGLRVAPPYRILPSSPTPRILITYVPALGLPTRLRLRLISSARSHFLLTAHPVAYPFQGSSRQRMDQKDGARRTRSTSGCTLSVTKSSRDPVDGSRRGLHLSMSAPVPIIVIACPPIPP